MSSTVSPETSEKRQRRMIIIADESIIDQIEKSDNISLLKDVFPPSEGYNIEGFNKQNKVQSSCKKNKPKKCSLMCAVCGSSATGYNFGVIACESCKAFFRRNARKYPAAFYCNYNSDCQITSETRRNCPACRLAKCFKSGMLRDRISTDEQKAEKLRQIEENRILAMNANAKTTDGFQSSPWPDNISVSMAANILLTDSLDLLPTQPQQIVLSPEDLQRIETISDFYQKRIEFAARDGLPWDPSMHTRTFLQVLNSHSVSVMRLLSFFKQIPEFNQLNIDDRITLIKNNLLTILGINCALSYNVETKEIIESDSDVASNVQFFPVLHGYNTCRRASKIFNSFLNIAKCDRKIIELILIILILTKGFSITSNHNERILNNDSSVYRAQNYFTELLWKYMEIVHGYNKAIRLYSELIVHIISWQTIHNEMRNNILRTLSPEDIDDLVPIMKSVLCIT